MERRLIEHKDSATRSSGNGTVRAKGAKALRGKGPLALAYTAPAPDRSIASKMEYRIKRLSKTEKEALVAGKLSIDAIVSSEDKS